jgi:uncharacterized membrane protein (DUF106 family)
MGELTRLVDESAWLLLVAAALVKVVATSITVGLKKPVAAMLICALLIGQPAWGPLIVGATIGLAVTGLRRTTTDD